VGFATWEPGDQSIVLGGLDKNGRDEKNWRISLNDTPAVALFDGCGMATDVSPDRKFFIATSLWGEHPGIYQYSVADKKCTPLKLGIATFLAMYADDGKSFLYSLASRGETTIFRQHWRNGSAIGPPVSALKLPFSLQDQPHISTRSQQFQARTAMLEGKKRSHNYPDTRRIQLGDIGQIDQYLAVSMVNQLS
jgi:hypothetical protein